MLMKFFLGLLLFTCAGLPAFARQAGFDYLKVRGHTVESTHKLRHTLKLDKSFKPLGEFQHRPVYGDKTFNVSAAAFARGDQLVMVHAEAHADGSGGLDYSNLTPDPLGGINFTSREQCAALSEIPDPDSIPDLRFLRERGFSPAPALFLKQYLIASPDGTDEYVLTYGRRVASCGPETVTPGFKAQIDRESKATLQVKKRRK